MKCCILIWNKPWDTNIIFTYIKKRNLHDISSRTGWDGTGSWSLFRNCYWWKDSAKGDNNFRKNVGIRNDGTKTSNVEKMKAKGGNESKYLLSSCYISEASQGILLPMFHRWEIQGSKTWRNLPWVTEFGLVSAGGRSSVCHTPDRGKFLLCCFTVLKEDSRVETNILRRRKE